MNRTIFTLTLTTLGFSLLWLVFMISSLNAAGPLNTFDRVLAHVENAGSLFYLNYLNAALVTLSATAFFASLYQIVRAAMPTRAVVGVMFVPVYCAINLFCYLTQVTLVPSLAGALSTPETAPYARLLLAELIHEWPGSTVAFFNSLAYALLGIPSILYGRALMHESGPLHTGGLLLILNGVACTVGLIGALTGLQLLSLGTLLGGGLFIAAMVLIAIGLRE